MHPYNVIVGFINRWTHVQYTHVMAPGGQCEHNAIKPSLGPQAINACTSGEPGPRRMAVLPVTAVTGSRRSQPPFWSSSGQSRSSWTGTTWASLCCSSPSSPRGSLRSPSKPRPASAWPTLTYCSTPGGATWSWPSWPSCWQKSTPWSRPARAEVSDAVPSCAGTSTLFPTCPCISSSPRASSTTRASRPGWWGEHRLQLFRYRLKCSIGENERIVRMSYWVGKTWMHWL